MEWSQLFHQVLNTFNVLKAGRQNENVQIQAVFSWPRVVPCLCSVFSPSCLAYVCGYECFLPCYHIHWQDGAVSDGRTATLAQKLLQSKWRNGNEITQHHCAQKHRPLESRESCCRLLWTSEGCKWASASPQGLSGSLDGVSCVRAPLNHAHALKGCCEWSTMHPTQNMMVHFILAMPRKTMAQWIMSFHAHIWPQISSTHLQQEVVGLI